MRAFHSQLPPRAVLTQTQTTLGKDLPATEAELFELNQFSVLDTQHAIELLGSPAVFKEMLTLMLNEQIPNDLPELKKAYKNKDWNSIEAISHKMKAGALYCGTIQLQIACQYLERYRKAGHAQSLTPLYKQLLKVIDATQAAIQAYLRKC